MWTASPVRTTFVFVCTQVSCAVAGGASTAAAMTAARSERIMGFSSLYLMGRSRARSFAIKRGPDGP